MLPRYSRASRKRIYRETVELWGAGAAHKDRRTALSPENTAAPSRSAPSEYTVLSPAALTSENVTQVTTSLRSASTAGASRLDVASARGWKVGYKARVGSQSSCEERFVTGFGSLLLDRPLALSHAQGAPVAMVKPTRGELRLFERAQLVLFLHSELFAPAIDTACRQGELLLSARSLQRAFDCRPVPRSTCLARKCFAYSTTTRSTGDSGARLRLVGAVPLLGQLAVREQPSDDGPERLLVFSEGLTLSDLRRLFDRLLDHSTGGAVTLERLEHHLRSEPDCDLAALFPSHSEDDCDELRNAWPQPELDFFRDFAPRFLGVTAATLDASKALREACADAADFERWPRLLSRADQLEIAAVLKPASARIQNPLQNSGLRFEQRVVLNSDQR